MTRTRFLSVEEARRITLRAQGLLTAKPDRTAAQMLRRLGAVQLDTISVLARSHELVAYARLGAVGRAAVERAYWHNPATAFEYYAHAACILPIEAWPYFAFRRRAQGKRSTKWRDSIPKRTLDEVRARLREGPVTTGDLGGAREGAGGWWNWSGAKMAVELLYYLGEAVVTRRQGWKRVYDLPERAIPAHLLGHEPTDAECYQWLVRDAGRALGVATRRDLAEHHRLLWGVVGKAPDAARLLDEAIADSGFQQVTVEGWDEPAYAHPAAVKRRTGEAQRSVLISPFDSLIWAPRQRAERLFGLSMKIEAYTPRHERVHGYFSMPLLWNGRIVGRADPKREGKTLVAQHVTLDEPAAVEPMASALRDAASWVGCDAVRVEKVRPAALRRALQRALG